MAIKFTTAKPLPKDNEATFAYARLDYHEGFGKGSPTKFRVDLYKRNATYENGGPILDSFFIEVPDSIAEASGKYNKMKDEWAIANVPQLAGGEYLQG